MNNPIDFQLAKVADGIGALVTLESLGITKPFPSYKTGSTVITLGDNSSRIIGSPQVIWHWGFVTQAQRDALRLFCPGASAQVYLITPTTENIDSVPNAPQAFRAQMIWPAPTNPENPQSGRRLEFNILFRQLSLQVIP